MVTKVLMPQLGEAVEEATITRWLKAEGDIVKEYEALVEVNTDKVDTEIPAPASGTLLKIEKLEEGTVVKAGIVLAWIGEPGESIPDDGTSRTDVQVENSGAETTPSGKATPQVNRSPSISPDHNHDMAAKTRSVFISPVVAKIAAEHSVDLEQIQGTGLNGRITKKDILAYIEIGKQGFVEGDQAQITPTPPIADDASFIPHSLMRRRIAEHMVLSKRISPHVTTVFEVDMSKIVEHRSMHKENFARDGVKLTFTAYFVAATAEALRAFPKVNASWNDDGLIIHREVNIGMATSLGEDGLIVPVVKRADELSLLGIARTINDLANRARAKQLQPEEVSGGTFTITNHGVSGSLFALPIINQPQCAILGIGKLQKRIKVLEDTAGYDTISVRPMVYLTLTFDHRILDGAIADYFLSKLVETLENWT